MTIPDLTQMRRQLERLPVEEHPIAHARALNMLGAALRDTGELEEADHAFTRAAQLFADHDLPLEQAAAVHNRALVARSAGEREAAVSGFAEARHRFVDARAWAHAGAAGRELGALELERGNLDASLEALAAAVEHADVAGDTAGLGAAENVRGLAELAAGNADRAVEAFRRSAGAHPRSVRPDSYAMAKANLAVAYEQSRQPERARLAARQALGSPAVPPPVAAQAKDVLKRLGEPDDDVHTVLDDEPLEQWVAVLREEVAWWAGASEPVRQRHLAELLTGFVERADLERVEAWLAVLLELPPASLLTVVHSTMSAVRERPLADQQRLRELISRALPRFPLPQWQRLGGYLDRAAEGLGMEGGWT